VLVGLLWTDAVDKQQIVFFQLELMLFAAMSRPSFQGDLNATDAAAKSHSNCQDGDAP